MSAIFKTLTQFEDRAKREGVNLVVLYDSAGLKLSDDSLETQLAKIGLLAQAISLDAARPAASGSGSIRFHNIGKANEEIARLDREVSSLTGKPVPNRKKVFNARKANSIIEELEGELAGLKYSRVPKNVIPLPQTPDAVPTRDKAGLQEIARRFYADGFVEALAQQMRTDNEINAAIERKLWLSGLHVPGMNEQALQQKHGERRNFEGLDRAVMAAQQQKLNRIVEEMKKS